MEQMYFDIFIESFPSTTFFCEKSHIFYKQWNDEAMTGDRHDPPNM